MVRSIQNLVFEGGGVLGIAYLGVLDYLYQNKLMKNIKRCAGTSAGSIAACITSFQLPFEDIRNLTNSLDYKKVPSRGSFEDLELVPEEIKNAMETLFGDINCLYRLITRYGWYSSEYFYHWLQKVIADQFNHKKQPPYTFQDFRNPALHKNNQSFHDLFIIGTNLTSGTSNIFSFDTTPTMEVAQAVRISMSIPLFFEAIDITNSSITGVNQTNVFCDGGVMNNYPIRLFDSLKFCQTLNRGANMDTLGVRFMSGNQNFKINNLLEYIWSLVLSSSHVQQEDYYNSPQDRVRSINIDTKNISPIDFNISTNDKTYQTLYQQGYIAVKAYFK